MINELYQLSVAMDNAGITVEEWHSKYKNIPNVKKNAPCIRIILQDGHITSVESVEKKIAEKIRKYGSNQGTYPAMNLAPLYRISEEDEAVRKIINDYFKGKHEKIDFDAVKSWCHHDNWTENFLKKYKISLIDTPNEMQELLSYRGDEFEPFEILFAETSLIKDAGQLHRELEEHALKMIERKKDMELALQILFYQGKPGTDPQKDYGGLSVILDCEKLIDKGLPAAGYGFTKNLNKALYQAERTKSSTNTITGKDAFGLPFSNVGRPMPSVKLSAGFEVTLRTMFKGQPCQMRYGRIEDGTYPLSMEMRTKLQNSLAWLGEAKQKDIMWINLDKDEALFAYPERLPEVAVSYVAPFIGKTNNEASFIKESKKFISAIKEGKDPLTDRVSDRIQFFVLRKIDKGRTKVVYAYNTTPKEIEKCSEMWYEGSRNLPDFRFDSPETPFPLATPDIMNMVWKQDGQLATDKFKPYKKYYGMELFFGSEELIKKDLRTLVSNACNIGPYAGSVMLKPKWEDSKSFIWRLKRVLSVMGLLLYKLGIGKEKYMKEFPYQLGQLLKISDALHQKYCEIVRNNDIPNQLVGSSLYISASEQPTRTMGQLAQRMNPYITWAKSYSAKEEKAAPGNKLVGWLLYQYGQIAGQLNSVFTGQTRLNDWEKAQLFIGYLAELPKKEKMGNSDAGVNDNEMEGEANE